MKRIQKLLVPTDLSENSRRGLVYGCSMAEENRGALTVLHVANEFAAWEFYSDEFSFLDTAVKQTWPTDRVLAEASLDLNRFLERHIEVMRKLSSVTKRVLLGSIVEQIVTVAEDEKVDLVVMSPRRDSGLRHILRGSITDRVTRMSPCPVLSVTPPLPSRASRGKRVPSLFSWTTQKTATI